jgi:ParB family chromosome partitioning protein
MRENKTESVTTSSVDKSADIILPKKTDNEMAPMRKPKNIKPAEDNILQEEKIANIALNKLMEFENHPFKVFEDEEFQKLKDSIQENGVVVPAVARPKDDGYELIAGHRRKLACQHLGMETMPVVVRNLTDEQAVLAMVESNVQREHILPSEKAFAYKMKLEALNRQGQRTDLTSTPVVSKFRTNEKLGQESGDSREQVRRYVRLTELIPQLLHLVDVGKIAFRPAVELSYLSHDQQAQLLSAMEAEQATPSLAQAQKLKAMNADGKITDDSMLAVMRVQKANQNEQVKIPYEKVREIIKKDLTNKEMEVFILQAITDYQKRLIQRQRNKDAR